MKSTLLDMIEDLIAIHKDVRYRIQGRVTEEFWVYDFDQTWESTALGFGGCGGSALTTARTYVLVPKNDDENAYVYFGGRFAYSCSVNDAFLKDLDDYNMASVQKAATRYVQGKD